MISPAFVAPSKPSSWAGSLSSLPWNMIPKYIPHYDLFLQDRAQPALSAVQPRVSQMVTSYTLHSSGAGQIVCPDTSPPAHSFWHWAGHLSGNILFGSFLGHWVDRLSWCTPYRFSLLWRQIDHSSRHKSLGSPLFYCQTGRSRPSNSQPLAGSHFIKGTQSGGKTSSCHFPSHGTRLGISYIT